MILDATKPRSRIAALTAPALVFALTCAAEPIDDPTFELNSVGFHHHGEVATVELDASLAQQYFIKDEPGLLLSAHYRDHVLPPLMAAAKNNEFKPGKVFPPRNPKCFAEVASFNKTEVQIKILKPLGSYRWHHHFQCLAIYRMKRNKLIDKIFSLEQLYQKFSFSYQGIGHGIPGPEMATKNSIILAQLGPPDYEFPSQSPSLGRFYYQAHDIHVVTHHYRIYYLEKGEPDWVPSLKEQTKPDKRK